MTTGVVLARTGGTFRVHTADGEIEAVLRGKLKHKDDDRVVAGDVVELELQPEGATGPASIAGVKERRSVLARRAGTRRRLQPIAANVDQVVTVVAAADPELNARMLDRLLVIAEANSLPAVIVVNKVELDREGEILPRLVARYAAAGYPVLATSVKAPVGLQALRDLLAGRESVICGPSGVGKSSLLNALQPGLNLRIGEISNYWRTGKHTTTAAVLIPIPLGGYVVDTPGMREVATWGLDPEMLAPCFPEFRPYLDGCKFDNCRHLSEPKCAVRAAAAAGKIDPDRLASYAKVYEEINVPAWEGEKRRGR